MDSQSGDERMRVVYTVSNVTAMSQGACSINRWSVTRNDDNNNSVQAKQQQKSERKQTHTNTNSVMKTQTNRLRTERTISHSPTQSTA
jgi:hypothetical protein